MYYIAALILLGYGIYLWLTKHHDYWRRRGIPYSTPYLFVGNMGQVVAMKKSFKQVLVDIYRDFEDHPYVGIFNMRTPTLLLRDIDIIKEVLIKEFNKFHDVPLDIDENLDPVLAKIPSFLKGERWKVVRSQMTPLLTGAKEEDIPTKGVDGKELAMKFTSDNVASCAFGLEANSFTDPNSEFRKWSEGFFNFSLMGVMRFFLVFIFPEIENFIKTRIGNAEVTENFKRIITETVKYRQDNGVVRNDFLDAIIEYKSKSMPFEYTADHMVANALTFFINGSETSAAIISFALFELAVNIDVQNRLKHEIDAILTKYGGTIITFEAIQEMSYLDSIFLETLRKYPPGNLIRRECTEEFKLPCVGNDGILQNPRVDKGIQVIIPVLAVHHNPEYYPEPKKFNPDRFIDEINYPLSRKCFLGFGDGPRTCLGQRFANMQIKAGLIAIVSNFDVRLSNKTNIPLQINTSSAVLAAKGGIWLNFSRRNKTE